MHIYDKRGYMGYMIIEMTSLHIRELRLSTQAFKGLFVSPCHVPLPNRRRHVIIPDLPGMVW